MLVVIRGPRVSMFADIVRSCLDSIAARLGVCTTSSAERDGLPPAKSRGEVATEFEEMLLAFVSEIAKPTDRFANAGRMEGPMSRRVPERAPRLLGCRLGEPFIIQWGVSGGAFSESVLISCPDGRSPRAGSGNADSHDLQPYT